MLGTEADAWTRTEQLLAGVVDYVARLAWQHAAAHRGPNTPMPEPPDPLPRPGIDSQQERRSAFLAALRARSV